VRRRTRAYDPLAMQKVVGSNPIIRSERSPARRGFLLLRGTQGANSHSG
jgi:hypothetical protein